MKKFIVFALLMVFFIVSMAWFERSESFGELEIISVKETYSIVSSHPKDILSFEFLSNQGSDLFWFEDNILSLTLRDEASPARLPLELFDIKSIARQEDYTIGIEALTEVWSQDFGLRFKEAYLLIHTVSHGEVKVMLGEVNYYYTSVKDSALGLVSMHNLAGHYAHGITSQGAIVRIKNNAACTVFIDTIHLNTEGVFVNMHYVKVLEYENIESIDDYAVFDARYEARERVEKIEVSSEEEITLLLPFSYRTQDTVLYRYPLFIEYTCNAEEGMFIFNDFPFIKTLRYDSDKEGLRHYESYSRHD